jgi:hypothetical protein
MSKGIDGEKKTWSTTNEAQGRKTRLVAKQTEIAKLFHTKPRLEARLFLDFTDRRVFPPSHKRLDQPYAAAPGLSPVALLPSS